MDFLHGSGGTRCGLLGLEADDAHRDGASGGEEDEAGEDNRAATLALGEKNNALTQGNVSGHGEGKRG